MTYLRVGHKSQWFHNTGYRRAQQGGISGSGVNETWQCVWFHYVVPASEWYQLNNSQRVEWWLRSHRRWRDLIDAIRDCQGLFGGRQSRLIHLCWAEDYKYPSNWFRHPGPSLIG